jgi:cysteinyl-tRNA synthetase
MTVRFFILQAHYRSQVDFSNQALVAAEKGMEKLLSAHAIIDSLKADDTSDFNFDEIKDKCYQAMNDDFNTPILISHLFEGVKVINSCKAGKLKLDQKSINQAKEIFDLFIVDLLGIKVAQDNKANDISDDVMQIVLELRAKAKEGKDWSTADLIRDELKKLNIEVKDSSEGSSWEIKEN